MVLTVHFVKEILGSIDLVGMCLRYICKHSIEI